MKENKKIIDNEVQNLSSERCLRSHKRKPASTLPLADEKKKVKSKDDSNVLVSKKDIELKSSRSDLSRRPHIWPSWHDNSKNVFHYLTNSSIGRCSSKNKKTLETTFMSKVNKFKLLEFQKPFFTRITAIQWHHKKNNFFFAGSKHGDQAFYKFTDSGTKPWKMEQVKYMPGSHPGGCISSMKFHPTAPSKFYIATMDNNVILGDIETLTQTWGTSLLSHRASNKKVILPATILKIICKVDKPPLMDATPITELPVGIWKLYNWFTSLDVHPTDNLVVAGTLNGSAYLISRTGEFIWGKNLHSMQINHLEFSQCQAYLLCSASHDKSVNLWDLRMVNEKNPLFSLKHDRTIYSATFSRTDGTRLLVTDKGNSLFVYRAPYWKKETSITHPHRIYQHITPIKATWCPSADVIMCGRYPEHMSDPSIDKKSIDFMDVSSGQIISNLYNSSFNRITSLCQFDKKGSVLLGAMGHHVVLWSDNQKD